MAQTAGDILNILDLDDLKGPLVGEKMRVYHQAQADAAPKQYLPEIMKEYDLVWHHMDFADSGPKVFLAKKCKKTGELVDLPSQDLSGPGKMRLFLPYGQVGIASLRVENFWGLDDPTESVVFIKPGEDGYDEGISSELTRCAEYMDKVLNHDRAEYLANHESELNNYPTMVGKSAAELKAELLDAMSKGQEANLAHSKSIYRLNSNVLEPDWTKRKAPHGDDTAKINRADERILGMFEEWLDKNPENSRFIQNAEGVRALRERLEASLETDKQLTLRLVHYKDAAGEDMDRCDLMTHGLAKQAVAAAFIEIPAIRVSEYRKDKPGRKGKKDKPGFKNVTCKIEYSELHFLANGLPWGKPAAAEIKYNMRDLFKKRASVKRSVDPDDEADDLAMVAAAERAEKKVRVDDIEEADPE